MRRTASAWRSARRLAMAASPAIGTPPLGMRAIVPSDAGHDIERLGGVRRLPFPVPLNMPPVGLIAAARHRDTPVVRNLRNTLRELVRKGRDR